MDKRRNIRPASAIAEKHNTTDSSVPLDTGLPDNSYVIESDEVRKARLVAMNAFMSKQFSEWQSSVRVAKGRYEDQNSVDHMELMNPNVPRREDTFTLNIRARPEGFNTDAADVLVLDADYFRLRGFFGKPVGEVLQHIRDEFGATHFFPDIQDLQWVFLTGLPKGLSDKDKRYLFIGSHFTSGIGEQNNIPMLKYSEIGVPSVNGYKYQAQWNEDLSVFLYKYK